MIATALDLITLAYRELGVLGLGETLSAELAAQGLVKLNTMVDSWRLDRGWLHQMVRTVHPLSALVDTYTIGPGGDINIPRPDYAPDAAGVIINTNQPFSLQTELPIAVLLDQDWQNTVMKGLQSTLIQAVYWDFDLVAGRGTLHVWPVPTVGNTAVVLYFPGQALAEFPTVHTTVSLLPGYHKALFLNLALDLAIPVGRPTPDRLPTEAREALAMVQRTNARPPVLRADEATIMSAGSRSGLWNYRTGDWTW